MAAGPRSHTSVAVAAPCSPEDMSLPAVLHPGTLVRGCRIPEAERTPVRFSEKYRVLGGLGQQRKWKKGGVCVCVCVFEKGTERDRDREPELR